MPNYVQDTTNRLANRDIWASSEGQHVTSYALRAASISADSAGDRIVYEGTVLTLHSGTQLLRPRVNSEEAIAVLTERVNLSDAFGNATDRSAVIAVGGWLREDRCRDNAVFGTVTAGAKEDLALLGLYFRTYEV